MRLQDSITPVIHCAPVTRAPTMTASHSQSPLFALPAELRNRIYEYTLLADEEVEITADLKQPPLLLTCRESRREATKLWYFRNTFACHITNCDARLLCAFYGHVTVKFAAKWEFTHMTFLHYIDEDTPNWGNLVKWCRAVWEGSAFGPKPDVDVAEVVSTVIAATDMAFQMRLARADWKCVERALTSLRYMAGSMDEKWLED